LIIVIGSYGEGSLVCNCAFIHGLDGLAQVSPVLSRGLKRRQHGVIRSKSAKRVPKNRDIYQFVLLHAGNPAEGAIAVFEIHQHRFVA